MRRLLTDRGNAMSTEEVDPETTPTPKEDSGPQHMRLDLNNHEQMFQVAQVEAMNIGVVVNHWFSLEEASQSDLHKALGNLLKAQQLILIELASLQMELASRSRVTIPRLADIHKFRG